MQRSPESGRGGRDQPQAFERRSWRRHLENSEFEGARIVTVETVVDDEAESLKGVERSSEGTARLAEEADEFFRHAKGLGSRKFGRGRG